MSVDATAAFALMVWDVSRCLTCGAIMQNRDVNLHVNWHDSLPIPAWHAAVVPAGQVMVVPLNTADPNHVS
jgi:hypothetical protein